jgi:hypothetical protein
MKVVMLAGAVAALALVGGPSQAATYEGPWCAHVSIGEGDIAAKCDMRSFEMCRAEIQSMGGPSYCSPNPYYRGPAAGDTRRQKPRRQ